MENDVRFDRDIQPEIIDRQAVPEFMNIPAKANLVPSFQPLDFTPEQVDLIKRMHSAAGLTNDEFLSFIHFCKRKRVDPLLKQAYATKRKMKDGTSVVAIMTSIDGLRAIADRTGNYCPGLEPEIIFDSKGAPICAKTTVKKFVHGEWHELKGVAYLKEFDQDNWMWRKMPVNQLIKCSESQALRKGWPEDCGGFFVPEEFNQETPEEIATGEKVKTERQRGSISKLKKSETENRGHGDEGMKAVETPVAEVKEPKEPKVPYDNYHTKVINAVQKNSNGKKWIELKVQGGEAHIWNEQRIRYETQEIPLTTLYCWHQSLFEALMLKPEKIVLAVRNQPNSKFSPVIEKIISEEPKPETGTLNIEQQRRDESLLVLSNTLEKLWPSSNETLRPLRNSVGRMLFNLERKEQLRELSYSQDTIDAANKALARYDRLQEKPQSDAGIINEIEICFKDELQVIAEAKMEPPKDLFSI